MSAHFQIDTRVFFFAVARTLHFLHPFVRKSIVLVMLRPGKVYENQRTDGRKEIYWITSINSADGDLSRNQSEKLEPTLVVSTNLRVDCKHKQFDVGMEMQNSMKGIHHVGCSIFAVTHRGPKTAFFLVPTATEGRFFYFVAARTISSLSSFWFFSVEVVHE